MNKLYQIKRTRGIDTNYSTNNGLQYLISLSKTTALSVISVQIQVTLSLEKHLLLMDVEMRQALALFVQSLCVIYVKQVEMIIENYAI